MNSPQPAPGSAAPGRDWARRLVNVLVALVVIAVAGATFVFSYAGVHAIAQIGGVSAQLARYYPGLFDAVLVIACVCVVVFRDGRRWARLWAWLVIIIVLAAIGTTDVLHAMNYTLRHRPTEGIVAAAPVVAVLLAFSLLLTLLRQSRTHVQPAPMATPLDVPALPAAVPAAPMALPAAPASPPAPAETTPLEPRSAPAATAPSPAIAVPAAPPTEPLPVPVTGPRSVSPSVSPSVPVAVSPDSPLPDAPPAGSALAPPTEPVPVSPAEPATVPADGHVSPVTDSPLPARDAEPGGSVPAPPTDAVPLPSDSPPPARGAGPATADAEPAENAAGDDALAKDAMPREAHPETEASEVIPAAGTAPEPAAVPEAPAPPAVEVPAVEVPTVPAAPARRRGIRYAGSHVRDVPQSQDYWDADDTAQFAGLVYRARDDDDDDGGDGGDGDLGAPADGPARRVHPELDDDAPPFATAPFAPMPRLNRVRSMPTPPADEDE